ncbi:MAG: ASCH domain-containing protein [Lachnospiraceae bacterium]|nr:ASCH domain-containing protein [Lachnospiraceae bacterium]
MRVLPILFNGEMVRAILDGRKTVTRRICKDGDDYSVPDMRFYTANKRIYAVHSYADKEHKNKLSLVERTCPICPGDILYVRETWAHHKNAEGGIIFRARCPRKLAETQKWYPSIHMPKEAARIWLKVTDVRIEKLQKIDEQEVAKEGINSHVHPKADYFDENQREMFAELWNSTLKRADLSHYGWDANPWVWVIEFEQCERPKEIRDEAGIKISGEQVADCGPAGGADTATS